MKNLRNRVDVGFVINLKTIKNSENQRTIYS